MAPEAGTRDGGDPVRLLAQRSEHAYTSNPLKALKEEPEAVDAATQAELTARSRRAERERLRAAWAPARSLISAGVVAFRPMADSRTQSDLRVIERTAQRIDQRLAGQ